MAWLIRPAALSDAAAMCAILNPLIADGRITALPEPVTAASQRRFLETLPARSVCLVACGPDTEGAIAMQDVLPDADDEGLGLISSFVHERFQGQGAGRALFAALRPRAAAMGYTRLRAIVRTENKGGQGFYAALGFIPAPPDANWSSSAVLDFDLSPRDAHRGV